MNYIVKNNITPLCFLPSGDLICYQYGKLIIIRDEKIITKYEIIRSKKERYIGRINLFFRLFRLGVRVAETIDDKRVLLNVGNHIYEYDFLTKKLSEGYYIGKGIRPLILTNVKNIKGFDDCICFGGYRDNMDKEPVHIYKRAGIDKWDIVHTFKSGEINHVHNIVADSYRDCLWAFTGDFDEASAVWKITNNFKKVERVLCNNQKYRGCVIFPVNEGLLYATDAPFSQNYIYLMKEDFSMETICQIDGSCIYGCQIGNKFAFSTTVEPDGRNNSILNLLISRKRGEGIKDMYSHLYVGSAIAGFKEVYKEKKDIWPYLFQFGVIRFPYGLNSTSKLYFQPVATNKHDLDLMIIDINI
ncbi:hypothetical protein [Bacteroides eggerthii]|jgi:hypothetical protein|nr:hypothetical protein [Bacteroides eggerthii]